MPVLRAPTGLDAAAPRAAQPADQLAWRDTDLQLRGPVVADFQKLFIATGEKQEGEPLAAKIIFPSWRPLAPSWCAPLAARQMSPSA